MELFSIICLSVILITIQHLYNWLWRSSTGYIDDVYLKQTVLTILMVFLTTVFGYFLVNWSIDWFLTKQWIIIGVDKPKSMVVFALICLIIIFVSIQHLLNWFWRKVSPDVFFFSWNYIIGNLLFTFYFYRILDYYLVWRIVTWCTNNI